MQDYNHVLPVAASSQSLYIYHQLIAYTLIETVTRLSGSGYLFMGTCSQLVYSCVHIKNYQKELIIEILACFALMFELSFSPRKIFADMQYPTNLVMTGIQFKHSGWQTVLMQLVFICMYQLQSHCETYILQCYGCRASPRSLNISLLTAMVKFQLLLYGTGGVNPPWF